MCRGTLAGEEGGANASTVFAGLGIAGAFKFIIDGLKLVPSEINIRVKGYAGEIGTQIYPAVMSVGYICGPRISSYMFAGGIISWLVLIPAIVLFGSDLTLYPGTAQLARCLLAVEQVLSGEVIFVISVRVHSQLEVSSV